MDAPPPFQSNYPRQQPVSLTYVRPPGVYWDSISIAFDMVKADFGAYVVSTLIAGIVVYGLAVLTAFLLIGFGPTAMFTFQPTGGSVGVQIATELVQRFVQIFLLLSLVSIGVRHALVGSAKISDLFFPFSRFLKTSAAVLIAWIPLGLLTLIQILIVAQVGAKPNPFAVLQASLGVFALEFVLALFFSGPLALGAIAGMWTDLGPFEAYVEAYRRVGWQFPILSILFVISAIIGWVGLLACCIGAIFTVPISTNVAALHFLYYFPAEAGVPVPPESLRG